MAPFTLDISETDIDTMYNIFVSDSRTSANFERHNSTDLSFQFECNYSSIACDFFRATVTPVNVVGQGMNFTFLQAILTESK